MPLDSALHQTRSQNLDLRIDKNQRDNFLADGVDWIIGMNYVPVGVTIEGHDNDCSRLDL